MSTEIKECTSCPTPMEQVFSSEIVVEDDFSIVPGIPRPEKVKIEPLLETFKIELVCGNIVVICGIIRKKITIPECFGHRTIVHDFAFQATIPVDIESSNPVHKHDIKITGVEVCTGCFKLLDATRVGCNTIFHRIREKDILRIEVTFKNHKDCRDDENIECDEREDY